MNNFKITLEKIQHINYLEYELDLTHNSLFCLVGKNGIGKTTLIKSIQNFKDTNTLDKMSRVNVINENSEIVYEVDENKYKFTSFNDDSRYILDNSSEINEELKKKFYIEFPIPYGKRFDVYSKLGREVGETIRTKFSAQEYDEKPNELIKLLNTIYGTKKYDKLEQIKVKDESYFLEPWSSENYLREDDFSSGEFMIIQIYKLIKNRCKLIVIDELDISLDSSAQVNLIQELRKLTQTYSFNILFTTHSLAIMKTMQDNELYFMENVEDKIIIENKSYNYIKAELFQFIGYDRIILVEDEVLEDYITYLLKDENIKIKYNIIHIGGHSQVINLMDRNKLFDYFNTQIVTAVLDGDQKDEVQYERDDISFIPFLSIEKKLKELYLENKLSSFIEGKSYDHTYFETIKSHTLYKNLVKYNHMSKTEIFNIVNNEDITSVQLFKSQILNFLDKVSR